MPQSGKGAPDGGIVAVRFAEGFLATAAQDSSGIHSAVGAGRNASSGRWYSAGRFGFQVTTLQPRRDGIDSEQIAGAGASMWSSRTPAESFECRHLLLDYLHDAVGRERRGHLVTCSPETPS